MTKKDVVKLLEEYERLALIVNSNEQRNIPVTAEERVAARVGMVTAKNNAAIAKFAYEKAFTEWMEQGCQE